MEKKKIILMSIAAIMAIMAIAIGNFITNNNEEKVKDYEVVDSNLDKDYVALKVFDKLDISSFMKDLDKLDSKEQTINFTFLKKYSEVNDILNIIKDYDSSFNESTYKVEYNHPYDDRTSGVLFFTYYIIDDKPILSSTSSKIEYTEIETNKSYMIIVDKGKVEYINLAGVKKENLDTIKDTDNKELIQLANDFNGSKKEKALLKNDKLKIFKSKKILNEDNTIKKSVLPDDVISYTESFLYDYNTKGLTYRFRTTVEFGEGHFIDYKLN